MLRMLVAVAVSFVSGDGRAVPPRAPAISLKSGCSDRVFRFQTNFWVNLHLFLRAEARRMDMHVEPEVAAAGLTENEKASWLTSVDAYRALGQKSVFDPAVVKITNALSIVPEASRPRAGSIDPALLDALVKAASVYRERLWPRHRSEDDQWIAEHCSDIQRLDSRVESAIASTFGLAPPSGAIVVDLARETGPNLAYTTEGLPGLAGHTVIAPQKAGGRHLALSTAFHEISHTLDDRIIDLVNRESSRQGVRPPIDLWHAITLYTTSVITEKALVREGQTAADVVADRLSLFERNHWEAMLAALEKDWRPHLDGRAGLDHALAALTSETGASSPAERPVANQ